MSVISHSAIALGRVDMDQVAKATWAIRVARFVFCVGNGGGYAHASHFASDLRKIVGKQSFAPDNGAELSARINDDGYDQSIRGWRASFGFDPDLDVTFMFSVGGGMDGLSRNLPDAPWGIVGKRGRAFDRIVVPSDETPVVEGCQSVIAHHIVEALRP